MDSPWCGSASSEVFPLSLSEDSGLLLSAGSGLLIMEQQDSDDDKSSLLDDSVAYSDHFNTLKKAPCWPDTPPAIKPPPEFQDTSPTNSPVRELRSFPEWLEKMAARIVSEVLEEALSVSWCRRRRRMFPPCWVPSLPGSRSSLSSRLSSSHNSLSVPMANRADDSSFITSAMSHDVLSMGDISDMYNVPLDCDVYAVPVDMLRPSAPVPPDRPKRHRHRRQRRYMEPEGPPIVIPMAKRPGRSTSMECTTPVEPIHMTLQEVRRYLHNLYSSSSDSSECHKKRNRSHHIGHVRKSAEEKPCDTVSVSVCRNNSQTHRKNTLSINVKNKKAKDVCSSSVSSPDCLMIPDKPKKQTSRGFNLSLSLKQTFCNIFRFGRMVSPENCVSRSEESKSGAASGASPPAKSHFSRRALPPLPAREGAGSSAPLPSPSPEHSAMVQDLGADDEQEPSVDFASSIEKVKDYGWYWGPISGEAAEKILSTEPDGSFIVRDSSDDHYIFSLTFKLNSCVRHVRIEQDQGNFSFGSCAKFKSHTIVDFIENAVEHSRSGRYLFFLHRRPVLGPMRVQLLHPVSRFKQVQSLQHMCRFVILKVVRRDLIPTLPLPRRVIDYLSTPHYYSEQLAEEAANRAPSPSLGDNGLFPYMAPNMAPNLA